MISINNIEAYILAGGKSSRMGQDKGFVLLHGKPMISYSIDLLHSLQIPFCIVSPIEAYYQFGCKVIADTIPEKGPMGGLYTALLNCRSEYLLLLCCDAPFISREVITHLLKEADTENISVAVFRNKFYPLCSIYPKSILTQIKTSIKMDNLKMRTFIEKMPHQMIYLDKLLEGKPHILSNFNTRSDIEDYKKTLNNGN